MPILQKTGANTMQDNTNSTRVIPLTTWPEYHPWPSISALRHLVFNAEPRKNSKGETIVGNGLEKALIRRGRRVLIHEGRFFEWLDEQNNSDAV